MLPIGSFCVVVPRLSEVEPFSSAEMKREQRAVAVADQEEGAARVLGI
jgi:hypothetical protein